MKKAKFLLISLIALVSCNTQNQETNTQNQETAKPVKFIYMADIHVESDFLESGKPVFTQWEPGNHAALARTFQFINEDPFCKDADFILFGGDQINTGYSREQDKLDDEMVNYREVVKNLDIYSNSLGTDLSSFKFVAPESYLCKENLSKGQEPMLFHSPEFNSRLIPIQGNHDTGVPEFYRECAFQSGDTRFICFFASYVGLPAPPGEYRSTGKISDEAYGFIESQMKQVSEDKDINHIVLVCHWAISNDFDHFTCPIRNACAENGYNDNRTKIIALAEKYGCKLYINGHEHNQDYPVGMAGCMSDINCGSTAKGSWSVVEICQENAVFHIYSTAKAKLDEHGNVIYTSLPEEIRTIEIKIK